MNTKKILILLMAVFINACSKSPNSSSSESSELMKYWTYSFENEGETAPLISDGMIYIAKMQSLMALGIEDGELIWEVQLANELLYSEKILVKYNQVVAVLSDKIKAWNANAGTPTWEFNYSQDLAPSYTDAITTSDIGFVFIADDGKLFTLDVQGNIVFEKQLDTFYLLTGVSYSNEKIFAKQGKTIADNRTLGRITALNSQTGDSLWAFDTDEGGFYFGDLVINNHVLYAGSTGFSPNEIIVALDVSDGEELWRRIEHITTYVLVPGDQHVYINTGVSIIAIQKQNGLISWEVEWDWDEADHNKPVYLEGYVYHVRDSEMLVINDKNGKVVHRENIPDSSHFWHVAASSDKVFAQTSRQLIAYQPWHLQDQ